MSTTHRLVPSGDVGVPRKPPPAVAEPSKVATPAPESGLTARFGNRALAVLRLSVGFVFLWAFLDKLVGLGYSTSTANSWINGGSPTKGFLSHLSAGPLRTAFGSIAGAAWADWIFMIGLLGIGVAVMLGIGLRVSAVAGSVMMLAMWVAEWPLARIAVDGSATGSTNPFMDYHLIYALALIAVAALAAGTTWGLGRQWARLPIVRRHGWLR